VPLSPRTARAPCRVINRQMAPLCHFKFVMKRYTNYYYYCQLICN